MKIYIVKETYYKKRESNLHQIGVSMTYFSTLARANKYIDSELFFYNSLKNRRQRFECKKTESIATAESSILLVEFDITTDIVDSEVKQ